MKTTLLSGAATAVAVSLCVDAQAIEPALQHDPADVPAFQQACTPGHKFAARAGAALGYDSNTRPPTETIRPGSTVLPISGPGFGGGPGPGLFSQALVDTSQSDTYLKANASLRHGYCLTDEQDSLAATWNTRLGVEDKRYTDLVGADEQGFGLLTGPVIVADWLWQVAPALVFDNARLEGEQYRQRTGLTSHQLWNLTPQWQAGFRLSAGRIEYDQVPDTIHVEGREKALNIDTSILLSPIYRVKFAAGISEQATDDTKLSYDRSMFQAEISRWHSLRCDAYLRYRIESSDYESLTATGDQRQDDLDSIEIGACAVFSPELSAAISARRTISDSNEIEFEYRKTQLEVSVDFRF